MQRNESNDFNQRREPLAILKAVRVEIDGKDLLLILTPFSTPAEAAKPRTPYQRETSVEAMGQLIRFQNAGEVVFVAQMPDGTFAPILKPDIKERILAKKIQLRDFLPLPIYAPGE